MNDINFGFQEALLNPAVTGLRPGTGRHTLAGQKKLYIHTDEDLGEKTENDTDNIAVWNLLGHASDNVVLTDAYAWVIAANCNPQFDPFVPALGMDHAAFTELLAARFPSFVAPSRWLAMQNQAVGHHGILETFPHLLRFLLSHRADADAHHRDVAHLVASACMGTDQLWLDLGLPDSKALAALFCWHFPVLAAKNTLGTDWKKFIFQQLYGRKSIAVR